MCPDTPPPHDRRYSDEEFRWILDEATKEPGPSRPGAEDAAPRPHPDGLTLDTIREIAREVGITKAAVDRAADRLDERIVVRSHGDVARQGPNPKAGYRGDFRVARRLSEAEMRMLLLEAERILGGAGTRERTAHGIRWHDAEKRIEVEIARGPDTTVVRASANAGQNLLLGWTIFGVLGLGVIYAAWSAWPASVFVVGPLALLATGAVMWLYRIGVRAGPGGVIQRLLEELRLAASLEDGGGSP